MVLNARTVHFKRERNIRYFEILSIGRCLSLFVSDVPDWPNQPIRPNDDVLTGSIGSSGLLNVNRDQ